MIQAWKVKHGLFIGSNGKKDLHLNTMERKAYRCWRNAKSRCTDKNSKPYPLYGGRGIKMTRRWIGNYLNFLKDMGYPPSPNHSIGRKDNNGNYCKSNCRWETMKQQSNNKRNTRLITIRGRTKPVDYWASLIGITREGVWYRYNTWPESKWLLPRQKGARK